MKKIIKHYPMTEYPDLVDWQQSMGVFYFVVQHLIIFLHFSARHHLLFQLQRPLQVLYKY